MNVTSFLALFMALTVITPIVTEGIKKFLSSLNVKYACNIIVLIVSVALSGIVSAFYFVAGGIGFTSVDVFYIFALALANWLGSMLGYDKVKQAIEQIISK